MEYKGFTYTPVPKTAWDNLSMLEKSEMMKVAVRNGITDLKTIRERYNEFAEGGDIKWTMEDEAKYMKWRQSLPDNLRLTNDSDYDMRAAFKAGMQPTLEADGLYHLGSRDPETGRILKAPHHPTYLQAINTDARMGYYPMVDDKGQTYTQTWEGNKFGGGGGIINGGIPFEITVTGKDRRPAWKRMYQNPNLGDTSQYYNGNILEDALSFTPVIGDAIDAVKAADAVNRGNYLEASILGGSLLLPNAIEKPVKAVSKLVGKGIKKITKENAAKILPSEWTAAQDAAVARGDMAEAQRLRDLHFKVNAPDTKVDIPLWTSSEEPFNSFDLSHFGETDSGFFGYGHYLTPIEKYAATYHPVNRKFYANIKNPYIGSNDQYFNRTQYVKDRLARRKENVMRNLRNGKLTNFSKKLGINENTSLEDAEHLVDKYIADETVKWNDRYIKYADEFEGKDGVLSWRELQGVPNKQEGIYKEVVVPRGEQLKSADAVTYDDNGVRIPLGERDNFNINDIRYAIAPFLIGGAAYGLSNEKADGGPIHIDSSKKGTFTAAASRHGMGVQEFASKVLANKDDYSPAMVKKANFARNAKHWKHGEGGNLFDGTSEDTQQMQIGKPFWQSQTQEPTFMESLAEFNRQQEIKKQQQRQALKERINTVGKRLAEERMREASIESNDNAWIDNRLTYKKKNSHLSRRAEEGAKAHAAWEKEHPNLSAWGNLAGAVPFAVASVPLSAGIVAGGDALATTTLGQAATSGLAPLYQTATGATIAGAPALAWANTGLQSLMASHGLSEAANGTFTPTTALELTPLAPGIVRTPGIINNLRPQNIRNHWYVAKPPIGYDGIGDAVERWVRGVASGKSASIDNPWWFNNSSAKHLQDYAYVPETVQGIEREQYLQQFGEHALKARADAWRMHNLIPQKYNTFTSNPRHPDSFTDIEGIRRLKYIPPQIEGRAQIDFVNSVGGNVGVPEITNLGNGIPDAGTQIKRFGVTTTSDWFDLHPFSRKGDRLRERFVKPLWDKHIAAPILYDARWMRKAADRFQYNEAEARAYLAQNKDNELAMELFDPDMFPTTGVRRKIGDAFEALSNGFKRAARTPEFRFLKPLEDKMAKLEAGDITGGKPFLVQYDIPFTTNIRFTSEAPRVVTEQVPGFVSENLLPQSVLNWKHGVSTEPANINLENNFDFLNTTLTKKSKR